MNVSLNCFLLVILNRTGEVEDTRRIEAASAADALCRFLDGMASPDYYHGMTALLTADGRCATTRYLIKPPVRPAYLLERA